MKRKYELILVLDSLLGKEDQKKVTAAIEKLLTSVEGKLTKTVDWGRKEFTYPIKKKTAGEYLLWELEIEPKNLLLFEKKLKIEESVLRYMIVKKEDRGAKKSK